MSETPEKDCTRSVPRRRLLGLVSGAVLGGFAGCSGDGDGTDEPTTSSTPTGGGGTETPLTKTATSTQTEMAPTSTQTETAATSTPSDATPTDAQPPESDWKQLFNQENLDDWTRRFAGMAPGEEYNNTIRVENGLLRIAYDEHDGASVEPGHLYYDGTFSHYAVRVEYRFPRTYSGGAFRNSGVMIHGPQPDGENALGGEEFQSFPKSIEVQLLGQDEGGGDRTTANLCTPGTHVVMDGELHTPHCTNSTSDTYPGDQWVTVTAVVRGNQEVRHYVEGTQVMSYSEPQLIDGTQLSEGTVSLQAEGAPIDFRTVELLEIDPDVPVGEGFVPPTPPAVSVDWPLPDEIQIASTETATVTAEVTNEDDDPITDGVITLEPDSPEIGVSTGENTTFDSLDPGDSQAATWEVTFPGDIPGGDYAFRAVVVYRNGGTVSETTGTLPVTVN